MNDKSAILILEAPWGLYEGDINRSSVEPFFQGLAKQSSDIEVLHSRFYDGNSFKRAFEALTRYKYKNAIVYVAGHGDGQRVGGAKILDIMVACNLGAAASNITGVVLGSCLSSGGAKRSQANIINVLIQESNLAWVAAYNCVAFWHESTMVDLSVIRQMIMAEESHFNSREGIVAQLAMGIECFSPQAPIGRPGSTEGGLTSLKTGVSFFAQPRGRGNRSRCVTEEVWDFWNDFQVLGEDDELAAEFY
ncbi:hypothetical protein HG264_05530 [Pseudomonas sp. gcc21]|uniref:hypothetical protein n=1 Tax=Pseudomonas sp. gcc21 TaxID=2726989 RepID=UPI00145278DB|nr:hypothetical protein [Pseudomonas sp. gcc21]QJD58407.1 hypothetical protein HG264_05530 [Pseudomonas sp. gcc21]